MRKRTLTILLAAWMLLALAGCGGKPDPEPAFTPEENWITGPGSGTCACGERIPRPSS